MPLQQLLPPWEWGPGLGLPSLLPAEWWRVAVSARRALKRGGGGRAEGPSGVGRLVARSTPHLLLSLPRPRASTTEASWTALCGSWTRRASWPSTKAWARPTSAWGRTPPSASSSGRSSGTWPASPTAPDRRPPLRGASEEEGEEEEPGRAASFLSAGWAGRLQALPGNLCAPRGGRRRRRVAGIPPCRGAAGPRTRGAHDGAAAPMGIYFRAWTGENWMVGGERSRGRSPTWLREGDIHSHPLPPPSGARARGASPLAAGPGRGPNKAAAAAAAW